MKCKSDWRFVQWYMVKRVANNDLTRIIGLIPLVGYLILFNDEIANIVSFNTIAGVDAVSASPFMLCSVTKLRLVFFGSFSLLFSYLLFRIFSPPVLEHSNGDLEFSARVRNNYSVYEIASMETQVISDSWQPRMEAHWIVQGQKRAKKPLVSGFRADARSTMFSKHSDYIHFLAREWWAGMMHTAPWARLSSMLFGIIGYILLALPTLDIAQAVLKNVLAIS